MSHFNEFGVFPFRMFYKVDNDDDDDSDSDNVVKLTGKSIRRLADRYPTNGSMTPSPLPPPPPPPPPHMHLVGPGDCTLPRPGTLAGLKRRPFGEAPSRNTWIHHLSNGRLKNEKLGENLF